MVWLWLWTMGCGGGLTHPSVVRDVKVVSLVADVPAVIEGAIVGLTLHIAATEETTVDVMVWSCTPDLTSGGDALSAPCYEEQLIRDGLVSESELIPFIVQDVAAPAPLPVSANIPRNISQLVEFTELNDLSVVLYALVCEADACPIIDRVVREAPTGLSQRTRNQLSDPSGLMQELPIQGVSATQRVLPIGNFNDNTNPRSEPRFLDANGQPVSLGSSVEDAIDLSLNPDGGAIEMAFLVTDDEGDRPNAYGYTTAGQFIERRVRAESFDGNATAFGVRHFLIPPETAQTAWVYVVFEDREGGADVWYRQVRFVP